MMPCKYILQAKSTLMEWITSKLVIIEAPNREKRTVREKYKRFTSINHLQPPTMLRKTNQCNSYRENKAVAAKIVSASFFRHRRPFHGSMKNSLPFVIVEELLIDLLTQT